VGLLQPRPLLLAANDLADQLLDLLVALDLDVAGLERLAVLLDRPLLGEPVEDGAHHLDLDRALAAERLGDRRTRQLDLEDLDVAPPPQVELEGELEVGERGDLGLEALDGGLDQLLSRGSYMTILSDRLRRAPNRA
jgi:hypothetical protein